MRTRVLLLITGAILVATYFPVAAQVHVRQANQPQQNDSEVQSVTVTLTDEGYRPASIKLRRGVPARVTFVREIEETCAKEIAIPEYKIKRTLPLNEAVVVEFTPNKSGEFSFACGMGMLRGKVVVQEK